MSHIMVTMQTGSSKSSFILRIKISIFLVYMLFVIALFATTCCNALPYSSETLSANNVPINLANLKVVRREDYDPYGFNSILSRFHKRSKSPHLVQHINAFPKEQSSV